jgi:hypothetical protein
VSRIVEQAGSVIDDEPGAGEERSSIGGEHGALRGALDELQPEVFLETAQPLRHGRLRDPQARCGATEVPMLGDSDEVAKMTD